MPSIQIKDVPEDAHLIWRARAAAAGQSLQEYLRTKLVREARTPTMAEALTGIRPVLSTEVSMGSIVDTIRADRDRR
jgi:plasmid stability protein